MAAYETYIYDTQGSGPFLLKIPIIIFKATIRFKIDIFIDHSA